MQARGSGEFEQPFNEQKRRALQRALEHLLLMLPEAELPPAFGRARPKRSAGTAAPAVRRATQEPGFVLQPARAHWNKA